MFAAFSHPVLEIQLIHLCSVDELDQFLHSLFCMFQNAV